MSEGNKSPTKKLLPISPEADDTCPDAALPWRSPHFSSSRLTSSRLRTWLHSSKHGRRCLVGWDPGVGEGMEDWNQSTSPPTACRRNGTAGIPPRPQRKASKSSSCRVRMPREPRKSQEAEGPQRGAGLVHSCFTESLLSCGIAIKLCPVL